MALRKSNIALALGTFIIGVVLASLLTSSRTSRRHQGGQTPVLYEMPLSTLKPELPCFVKIPCKEANRPSQLLPLAIVRHNGKVRAYLARSTRLGCWITAFDEASRTMVCQGSPDKDAFDLEGKPRAAAPMALSEFRVDVRKGQAVVSVEVIRKSSADTLYAFPIRQR